MRGRHAVAAAILLAAATACSGSSTTAADASSTPSATALALPSPSAEVIDPNVPLTQTYRTAVFRPALTVKLPADWYPTERDESAFQMYAGDEDYEITFADHYAGSESVTDAIARLKKTEGIVAGPVSKVSIGGRVGMGFVASRPGPVRLTFDGGFHVPGNSDIEVMAVPLTDGTTLTVFITRRVGDSVSRSLETTRQLARRILATVKWR